MIEQSQVSLGRRKIVSRQEFRDTFSRSGNAERALEVLDSHKVFSCYSWTNDAYLSYSSPKLSALTILGLYVHFTGSLNAVDFGEDGGPRTYQAGIVSHTFGNQRTRWKHELGLTLKEQCKGQYSFSTHGKSYARLLHLMGYSTGLHPQAGRRNSKAARGAQLPRYLSTLVGEYDSLNDLGKRIAKCHLNDLVSVLCETSTLAQRSYSAARIRLPSQRKEKTMWDEALLIVGAMNIAFPRLGASMKNNFSPEYSKNNHDGYLNFPFEQVIGASSTCQVFPIRFKQVVEPRFSGF